MQELLKLIEQKLKTKTRERLAEERMRLAAGLLDDDELTEAATKHPIPGLSKWNRYAGGTGSDGKHNSFDFYADHAPEKGRSAFRQYSISPYTTKHGRHAGYITSVWDGISGPGHKSLGTHRNPHDAVRAARAYHDSVHGELKESTPIKRVAKPVKRQLSIPDQHQLAIARKTLRMPDAMLGVMGGPSKEEARRIIKHHTGEDVQEAQTPLRPKKRQVNVFDHHQLQIARQTLRYSDEGAHIMGGMTKDEARAVIKRITGRDAKEERS